MASAKDGFPHIVKLFAKELAALDPAAQPQRDAAWERLCQRLDTELLAVVEDVVRLTPTIVEVIVKAPAAARHFYPGQFYRLQNYESVTPRVKARISGGSDMRAEGAGTVPLLMEGIALTGAWVDKERGLLSLIALELGVSSRLCAYLKKGEPVVVMGPTGTPTEIPKNQNVLLLGGGLGNAVLFSIAKAMRDAGNRVIYFAGYKKGEDLFKREDIEAATDQVVWSTDTGAEIPPGRPQDAHFRGNIVQAMLAYNNGELGKPDRAAADRRPHHRHRLRSHDGGRESGAPRSARTVSEERARRHRQHQLADAVHDEGSLRAVPAEARRPGDGQGRDYLLVLQSGPGARSRRFSEPGRAPAAEYGAGETGQHVARSPAGGPEPAAYLVVFVMQCPDLAGLLRDSDVMSGFSRIVTRRASRRRAASSSMSTDRSINALGSSTSSTDSEPSGRVMTTR